MQIYAVLRNLVLSTRMLYNTSVHIRLIGGRVCNPRQQQNVLNIYLLKFRIQQGRAESPMEHIALSLQMKAAKRS